MLILDRWSLKKAYILEDHLSRHWLSFSLSSLRPADEYDLHINKRFISFSSSWRCQQGSAGWHQRHWPSPFQFAGINPKINARSRKAGGNFDETSIRGTALHITLFCQERSVTCWVDWYAEPRNRLQLLRNAAVRMALEAGLLQAIGEGKGKSIAAEDLSKTTGFNTLLIDMTLLEKPTTQALTQRKRTVRIMRLVTYVSFRMLLWRVVPNHLRY